MTVPSPVRNHEWQNLNRFSGVYRNRFKTYVIKKISANVRFEPTAFQLLAVGSMRIFSSSDFDPEVRVRPKTEEVITIPIHSDPVDLEDPRD